VCTPENNRKAFEATGVIPFNPSKIDLTQFPTSSSTIAGAVNESPLKVSCSNCKKENVELHPLVNNKLVPKHLAEALIYTPPPDKSKSKSKVVEKARLITSEKVKEEIRMTEARKAAKQRKLPPIRLLPEKVKNESNKSDKLPPIRLLPEKVKNESNKSDDVESDDDESDDVESYDDESDDVENDDDESDDVENDDDDVHLNIEKVIFFQIQ
jgi:hypothetical protein